MDAHHLAQAMGIPVARAALWAREITSAFQYAQLTTPERRAAFLAQIGHESGGLQYVCEIWGPTPAQRRYEGRSDLGNTQRGDGFRYRGRGLIQMTGRANYARLASRLHGMSCPDFEQTPEALERPRWAALSAADYWLDRDLNRFCTPGRVRFKALTRAINGGFNGLTDRLARYERAFAAQGSA
jgi:putative chitinase